MVEETMSQLDTLPSNKSSSARNGLHLVELLSKGVPQNSSIIPGYCRGYWFPQPDDKALLLKTALTSIIECGEIELLPKQKLLPYSLTITILEDTFCTVPEEKGNHHYHPAFNLVIQTENPPSSILKRLQNKHGVTGGFSNGVNLSPAPSALLPTWSSLAILQQTSTSFSARLCQAVYFDRALLPSPFPQVHTHLLVDTLFLVVNVQLVPHFL